MLISNQSIGIIGGGQLAKLLALDAKRLGLRTCFWAKENETPIHGLGERFDDSVCDLSEFCASVDAVLLDYEHLPLREIEVIEQYAPYTGEATLLRVGRDRLMEKQIQEKLSILPNPYVIVDNAEDLQIAKQKLDYPFILKKRTHSYDGIGQALIKSDESLSAFLQKGNFQGLMAEKFLHFDKEVSLVSVRGQDGEFKSYDLCENRHQNGILTFSKNIQNDPLRELAHTVNKRIAERCQYVGTFAVEYFCVSGKLIINEISPRVHNSGHWTLDGTMCSQFENHIRACLGLSLGSTESHSEVQMINLLGDFDKFETLLEISGARFYNYNKSPRSNRKIGHVNISTEHFKFSNEDLEKLF